MKQYVLFGTRVKVESASDNMYKHNIPNILIQNLIGLVV